jgi:hypothetical protein
VVLAPLDHVEGWPVLDRVCTIDLPTDAGIFLGQGVKTNCFSELGPEFYHHYIEDGQIEKGKEQERGLDGGDRTESNPSASRGLRYDDPNPALIKLLVFLDFCLAWLIVLFAINIRARGAGLPARCPPPGLQQNPTDNWNLEASDPRILQVTWSGLYDLQSCPGHSIEKLDISLMTIWASTTQEISFRAHRLDFDWTTIRHLDY